MRIDRRDFLRVSLAASGGLLVTIALPRCSERGRARLIANAFVALDPDGTATITIPRPEMGQGVRTSLAILVAEELEMPWERVRIRQADLAAEYGDQYVGGSNSIHDSWLPLRKAGAAARCVLIAAAAKEWNLAASRCRATNGTVVDGSGRVRPYVDLLEKAATISPPREVPLKDASKFSIIGTARRQIDTTDIVQGRPMFGIDATVEGMLVAVVERAPRFGARIEAYDPKGALGVPGVRLVVPIDADQLPDLGRNNPKPPSGIAIVADDTWTAMEGRRKLSVTWSAAPVPAATESLRQEALAAITRTPEAIIRNDGDFDRAYAAATTKLDVIYDVPFQAHASMEPMNCTCSVGEDRCDLWVPTQNPSGVLETAKRITGLATSSIHIHPQRMGGGFGRRFYSDFVAEALVISKAARRPVRVLWTREDDIRHDFYRPASVHRMRGAVDPAGNVVAWSQFLANASRGEFLRFDDPGGATSIVGEELGKYDFPAGFIPHLRLQATALHSPIPRGQWRSIEDSTNVFVYQSFIDELAHAHGTDPVAFRRSVIGPPRRLPLDDDPRYTYDCGRLIRVLEMAAEKSRWGSSLPPGHGRGIACALANGAFVAEVAEVAVVGGRVIVPRVVAVVDCGTVVHPSGASAQVEGGILFGLGAALKHEITVADGGVLQSNFHDFPLVSMPETPRIEVHFVPSTDKPLGLGEAAVPLIAPAVANAIFAATGRRYRRLPIRIEGA